MCGLFDTRGYCALGRHYVKSHEILIVNKTPYCPRCPRRGKQTQLRLNPRNGKSIIHYNNNGGPPKIIAHVDAMVASSVQREMKPVIRNLVQNVDGVRVVLIHKEGK